MSQIAQQMIAPTFTDPNGVPETYVNGPISLNIMGPCVTITFTVVRGDLEETMKGQSLTKLTATVAERLTMPLHAAAQLRAALNKLIQDQPPGTIVPGSNMTQ
jgi:hypothetical protein